MSKVLRVALLTLLVTPLAAQTPEADAILAAARKLYSEQGPRAALPEFERALASYRKAGDRRGEAITLGYVGNSHKRLGNPAKALEYLRRALALKQEIGDRLEEGKTYSHLGLLYWEMGEYAQAIEQLTRSLAIAQELDHLQLKAAALNNLSLVYDEQGKYRESLEQYQRALEIHRATGSAADESATLGNIGGVYLLLGRYKEALQHYRQALAISERLDLKPSASQDLGNIALCLLGLGEPEQALRELDRALALATGAGLHKETADWRKAKGSVWLQLGRYSQARAEYEEALAAYERGGLKREKVEALIDMGALLAGVGDLASAEWDFRRALELARAVSHDRGITVALRSLGDLHWRRRQYEQAAALYGQSLERARATAADGEIAIGLVRMALTERSLGRWEEAAGKAAEALEISRAAGARPLEAQALYVLGELARAGGIPGTALEHYAASEVLATATNDPELAWRIAYARGRALESLGRNDEAVTAYFAAVKIIESVREQLREERFRAGYIEDKWQVYTALVQLLLKQGSIGLAFETSERLRARRYVELIQGASLPSADPRAPALRTRIRELQRALAAEAEKAPQQQRGDAANLFSGELAAAEREYAALLDDLRGSAPETAAALRMDVATSAQVQAVLPADTALIAYVVSEDQVTIFVLTAHTAQATTVAVRAIDLQAKVELLRELLADVGRPDWQKPAASLRRLLVDPVEQEGWLEGIRRVYLVPHGILHYLPFAALPGADQGSFLIDQYVLAYLPAATAITTSRASAGEGAGLFALAPARTGLRYAQPEARAVGRYFAGVSQVLLGRQASESAFKERAAQYDVLHLASHGRFNRSSPLFSHVELESGKDEDGRLEVHEILGMRLRAKLVTLSSCDTALGSGYFAEIPAGDEFVGLTRAFLFAGSSSVLASLWEVRDDSTLQLMRVFYSRLRATDSAAALAQAMREMRRKRPLHAHPYHWAPFVFVGPMAGFDCNESGARPCKQDRGAP